MDNREPCQWTYFVLDGAFQDRTIALAQKLIESKKINLNSDELMRRTTESLMDVDAGRLRPLKRSIAAARQKDDLQRTTRKQQESEFINELEWQVTWEAKGCLDVVRCLRGVDPSDCFAGETRDELQSMLKATRKALDKYGFSLSEQVVFHDLCSSLAISLPHANALTKAESEEMNLQARSPFERIYINEIYWTARKQRDAFIDWWDGPGANIREQVANSAKAIGGGKTRFTDWWTRHGKSIVDIARECAEAWAGAQGRPADFEEWWNWYSGPLELQLKRVVIDALPLTDGERDRIWEVIRPHLPMVQQVVQRGLRKITRIQEATSTSQIVQSILLSVVHHHSAAINGNFGTLLHWVAERHLEKHNGRWKGGQRAFTISFSSMLMNHDGDAEGDYDPSDNAVIANSFEAELELFAKWICRVAEAVVFHEGQRTLNITMGRKIIEESDPPEAVALFAKRATVEECAVLCLSALGMSSDSIAKSLGRSRAATQRDLDACTMTWTGLIHDARKE